MTVGTEGAGGGAAGGLRGAVVQAPRATAATSHVSCLQWRAMWLIIVEALLALGLLCFIVWWTMFHKPRARDVPPRDVGRGDHD